MGGMACRFYGTSLVQSQAVGFQEQVVSAAPDLTYRKQGWSGDLDASGAERWREGASAAGKHQGLREFSSPCVWQADIEKQNVLLESEDAMAPRPQLAALASMSVRRANPNTRAW